jgi:hypothetical protein
MSYQNGPRIVTDSLTLCLDSASNKSYSGSGANWNDISGSGYNATLYNSPTLTNNYFSLNGTSQYAIVPYVLEPLSVEASFYMNNRNDFPIIYAGVNTFNSTSWQWSIFNYASNTYWAPGSTSTVVTSVVPVNSWVIATIIRKSSSSLFYINGNLVSTFGAKTTTTGNIYIGLANPSYYMSGRVSTLKLYNKELSSSEVLQNYNAIKGRYGL